jgi:hypothetical protein
VRERREPLFQRSLGRHSDRVDAGVSPRPKAITKHVVSSDQGCREDELVGHSGDRLVATFGHPQVVNRAGDVGIALARVGVVMEVALRGPHAA